MKNTPAAEPFIRLDLWLWYIRFTRTRSLCTQAIATNSIRVNGQHAQKPHHKIKVGDILTLPHHAGSLHIQTIQVLSLPQKRGSPAEASQFYTILKNLP
ncbi:RNA-binding S4 domain-containing protein [Entomobacter blattae]|uniref:Heat shock protein 15 n=1 Tax=Entomobacter blattae TaxID=2762277 RepID=A0A7H1NRY4_9PROT|nr:S4 domain-containing protein [Entomobacter blattae]QNT78544.1 Heat shock protein 15 [Entomobacter blattae]